MCLLILHLLPNAALKSVDIHWMSCSQQVHKDERSVSVKKTSLSSLIIYKYRETTKMTCLLTADPSLLVVDAPRAFSYCN